MERIVPPGQSKVAHRIDSLMEQASEALVQRRYFDCERLAADALRRAVASSEYDRAARIVLPLQEARRQIRDLAVDAGNLFRVEGEVPTGSALKAGMYLLSPPRVGVDGRLLREAAMQKHIPVVVVVREPTTKAGLWPIVAVGPVTVRARIAPPSPTSSGSSKSKKHPASKPAATSKTKGKPGAKASGAHIAEASGNGQAGPSAEWILQACEALGDAAIASIPDELSAAARVIAIAERLEAVPDHEKLHQRLETAAREAARVPVKRGAQAKAAALEELEE